MNVHRGRPACYSRPPEPAPGRLRAAASRAGVVGCGQGHPVLSCVDEWYEPWERGGTGVVLSPSPSPLPESRHPAADGADVF